MRPRSIPYRRASDIEQLERQHEAEKRLIDQHKRAIDELDRVLQTAKNRRHELYRRVNALRILDDEEEIFAKVEHLSPDELEAEIATLRARLDLLSGGGNSNTIREFEERAKRIESRQERVGQMQTDLAALDGEIVALREKWEPAIDQLVGQISDAFAENFSKIQCAGEVGIHKDEDFDQWAIQIKVKFR